MIQRWPPILAALAMIGVLALLWFARHAPIVPAPFVYIDALGAFLAFVLLAGLGLGLATSRLDRSWRILAGAIVLLVAFFTSAVLVCAIAYLLLAFFTLPINTTVRWSFKRLRATFLALAEPLAGMCLLIGYGAMAWRGVVRFDERVAGAALDSFVFWFVLLAAVIPLAPLVANPRPDTGFFRIAWLYPLIRLYSLGPWNPGWSFATLLLGGGVAIWCAITAFSQARPAQILPGYLGLALAGVGLSSGAGLAAACYGMLSYQVLCAGFVRHDPEKPHPPVNALLAPILPWLLTAAIPFSAPFVASWMLIGAGAAGGISLLAGAAWLATLLGALAVALAPPQAVPRPPILVALASLLLGVLAPVALRFIQPVIEQLQGGLTPFGSMEIWPWVGMAARDSANRQVTTLPSIALAALMLVLCALVYLLARLWEPYRVAQSDLAQQDTPGDGMAAMLAEIRAAVPWLAGSRTGERPDED